MPDFSNPQYITIGNPDLRPEFASNLQLRYNNFDLITGNTFFGAITGAYTNDKIVNNVFIKGPGQCFYKRAGRAGSAIQKCRWGL